MDAIRKAYREAVQIPMENMKRLWDQYQEFESSLNKTTVCTGLLACNWCAQW